MDSRRRSTRSIEAKQVLNEFANTTSCHGVPRIIVSKTITSKLIWTAITTGAFASFIIGAILLVRQFFSFPSTSKVIVKGRDIMEFPQVTLCNMNMLKRSLLKGTEYEELIQIDNVNQEPLYMYEAFSDYENPDPSPLENEDKKRTRREADYSIVDEKSYFGEMSSDFFEQVNYFLQDYESYRERAGKNESQLKDQNWTKIVDVHNVFKMDSWGEKVEGDSETMMNLGHQGKDFILHCMYNSKLCSYRDFKQNHVSGVGNCYTFNYVVNESYPEGSTVLKTRKRGTKSGLQLTLNIEADEYIGFLSPEVGIRVSIHPPYIQSFPHIDGIVVSPGYSTSIGMRQATYKRLPKPHGECEDGDRKLNGYHYSATACYDKCLDRFVKRNCKCHLHEMYGSPICNHKNYQQRVCKSFHKNVFFDGLRYACICPKTCNETSYRKTVSTSIFPSVPFTPHILEMLKRHHPNVTSYIHDRRSIRENLARLKIFYEELSLERIDQIPLVTEKDLLSQIGGMMGLFIGLSVITLFEFLHLIKSLLSVFLKTDMRVQTIPEMDSFESGVNNTNHRS